MSATPSMLLPERQRRLLGFMGIELYERRGARKAPDAAAQAPMRHADTPAARRAPAPTEALPLLVLRLDGNARELVGRHGRLIDHVVAALGVDRAKVRIDHGGDAPASVPLLCLGGAPGGHPRAILGPPLATLAASGPAKAALWRALRRARADIGSR